MARGPGDDATAKQPAPSQTTSSLQEGSRIEIYRPVAGWMKATVLQVEGPEDERLVKSKPDDPSAFTGIYNWNTQWHSLSSESWRMAHDNLPCLQPTKLPSARRVAKDPPAPQTGDKIHVCEGGASLRAGVVEKVEGESHTVRFEDGAEGTFTLDTTKWSYSSRALVRKPGSMMRSASTLSVSPGHVPLADTGLCVGETPTTWPAMASCTDSQDACSTLAYSWMHQSPMRGDHIMITSR